VQSETSDFAPGAATWWTRWNTYCLLFRPVCSIMWKCVVIDRTEVRNISYCRQRRTKPWPQVAGGENVVKFGRVWFLRYVSRQTDTQTYWSQYVASLLGAK